MLIYMIIAGKKGSINGDCFMTKEQFWKLCLRVARSKPHLDALAVEAEAALIKLGLKPYPKESTYVLR